ncbi:hypothetical protein [Morganella sp. EGD-HP17]|uniref:hypothetical protein n=1 Tax=Morganella sp. EGD-HP17 TaxID=1435146 RepID=UPI00041CB378|nr:hypothetical protein [Morganella sp. EGD-HP17]ETO41226.1 hypothetical protein X965_11300 [Morganella sp. EGD-HP17]
MRLLTGMYRSPGAESAERHTQSAIVEWTVLPTEINTTMSRADSLLMKKMNMKNVKKII